MLGRIFNRFLTEKLSYFRERKLNNAIIFMKYNNL